VNQVDETPLQGLPNYGQRIPQFTRKIYYMQPNHYGNVINWMWD